MKLKLFHTENKTTNAYFNDLILVWFENYSKTLKEGTHKIRLYCLNQILKAFKDVKLKSINTEMLQKYIDSLEKNVSNIQVILKLFFDYAFNNGFIKINYFENVFIPKRKVLKNNKDKFLTRDELIKFLECVENKKYKLLFRVLAFTGARINEVLALKWEDIDFKKSTVNIYKTLIINRDNTIIINDTKNGVNREISIDETTLQLLQDFKENKDDRDFIFKNSDNRLLYASNVTAYIKNICKKYNLKPISCHTFRHTHATLLYFSSVSAKDIQNRLGHTDINTTLSIYTHILEDKQVIDKFSDYMFI